MRWNNALVLKELTVLFGENKKARDDYLAPWVKNAEKEIISKMTVFKLAEEQACGGKSDYFC